jgi:trimeric autotransporter adhesin
MATLTGNPIKDSYDGLIKTTDNAAIGAVEKEITDGLGNVSNLKIGTTSSSFTGTLDLTGATVTGLPDVDTTYSISSVQDGANSDIKLEDQLGNSTKVTLVAGTNITLTNSGNDVTIEAAGGAAGLELGTGALSLQNGIGGVSNASGVNSVAIGNATAASQEASIALGDRATATGYGSFAAGLFAQAAGFGGFALGQYAESSQSYGSAFGPSSKSIAESAIAFGQATEANHAGAIAMGRQVVTVNTDTTHVRALYIVAPDNGTGGNGITMLSPDGTAYTLTVSNAGALVIS